MSSWLFEYSGYHIWLHIHLKRCAIWSFVSLRNIGKAIREVGEHVLNPEDSKHLRKMNLLRRHNALLSSIYIVLICTIWSPNLLHFVLSILFFYRISFDYFNQNWWYLWSHILLLSFWSFHLYKSCIHWQISNQEDGHYLIISHEALLNTFYDITYWRLSRPYSPGLDLDKKQTPFLISWNYSVLLKLISTSYRLRS